MRLKIYLLLVIASTISKGFAQTDILKFQRIGIDQGLSQSAVTYIMQDSEGFIWVCTRDGLNKFDGYKFVVYKNNPINSNSLSNNNVRKISEDKDGNFWIATWGGGLDFFDKTKETFTHYKYIPGDTSTLSNNFVHTVIVDFEGKVWIGTDAGGVNVFDPVKKTFKKYKNNSKDSSSLSHNEIRTIIEDKEHNIWIGTRRGLNVFNRSTQKIRTFYHNPQDPFSLSDNFIRGMMEDRNGNIWLGTYEEGLIRYNKKEDKFYRELHSFGSEEANTKSVLALAEDEQGNLWVGTENGGLTIYNPTTKSVKNYQHDKIDPYSLSNNSIYCIFEDIKGNVWIGTFNDGISFLNKDFKFRHYRQTSGMHGMSNNIVLCIYEDSKNRIWVSTDGGGVNRFDPKTGKFYQYLHKEGNPNTIAGNHVLSICEDPEGNIWLGLWAAGISVLNPETGKFTHFNNEENNPKSLGNKNVWKIFRDSKNTMWIGTYGNGLDLYDSKTKTFRHFNYNPDDPDGISYNNLYNIYEDSRGLLWITTDGGGISILDPKTFKFETLKKETEGKSLSSNSTNSIYEDKGGKMWIATSEGLNHYDPATGKFEYFHMKDGLPNEVIMGILEDGSGNLWLSTNNGLCKFNLKTRKAENFTLADGLESVEFRRHAFLKSRSGLMYFGGKNGFNEFDPNQLKRVKYDPPLVLTGFSIFNKPVPIAKDSNDKSVLKTQISKTQKIEINHTQSVISFDFASLNYTFPEKKQYAYYLEGFEDDWNYVGTATSATYTNLNPGTYIFRVKGLDNEGNWSRNEIALTIIVTPPFWMTIWFRILAVLIIISIVYTVFILRLNIIKRQKLKLEVQVRERTSEVIEQKEEIINQRKELERLYKDTLDSILAAKEIQQSIFPSEHFIKSFLPESFILNKPKDVVSGDFYWFDEVDGKLVFAVADCTGHGVSGAFMSLLGHNLFNQSIYTHSNLTPAQILNRVNEGIKKVVKPQDHEARILDGMDVALCIIDRKKNELQYSGARCPLYLIRKKELHEIKASRFAIGFTLGDIPVKFENNSIKLEDDDVFYIFSDGYADQIGGKDGMEKFKYQRFREMLLEISELDMEQQKVILEETLLSWRKDTPQLDDVMIVGFKLTSNQNKTPTIIDSTFSKN